MWHESEKIDSLQNIFIAFFSVYLDNDDRDTHAQCALLRECATSNPSNVGGHEYLKLSGDGLSPRHCVRVGVKATDLRLYRALRTFRFEILLRIRCSVFRILHCMSQNASVRCLASVFLLAVANPREIKIECFKIDNPTDFLLQSHYSDSYNIK